MNTFEKIVAAVAPFGYPYAPDVYNGPETHWFTYNYADDRGELFGDDDCVETTEYIQLHLFLPVTENFLTLKNDVRKALVAQGFTYASITVVTEAEEKLRHIIWECSIDAE